MRRIPPYIDCILQYYLMETYGQVACTARTRGTIGGGTGGTIGGHRRHNPGTIDFGGVRK